MNHHINNKKTTTNKRHTRKEPDRRDRNTLSKCQLKSCERYIYAHNIIRIEIYATIQEQCNITDTPFS